MAAGDVGTPSREEKQGDAERGLLKCRRVRLQRVRDPNISRSEPLDDYGASLNPNRNGEARVTNNSDLLKNPSGARNSAHAGATKATLRITLPQQCNFDSSAQPPTRDVSSLGLRPSRLRLQIMTVIRKMTSVIRASRELDIIEKRREPHLITRTCL